MRVMQRCAVADLTPVEAGQLGDHLERLLEFADRWAWPPAVAEQRKVSLSEFHQVGVPHLIPPIPWGPRGVGVTLRELLDGRREMDEPAPTAPVDVPNLARAPAPEPKAVP
jgi:hypothetical protein